jgi:hypothetical protein
MSELEPKQKVPAPAATGDNAITKVCWAEL